MFWNQYPYINLNDLNLDFLLKAIGEMQNEVENFVTLNAVKYADPIQWNITKQYQKNTIVIDPLTGTAYISTKPVPSGVALNDTNYWTVVFDLSMFVTQANENLTVHVEGAGVVYSTFPLDENDWVIWNGVLYKALVNMPIGTAYSVGSNIERVTVEDFIKDILTAIANEVQDRIDADTTLQTNIDNEAIARANADLALSNNIGDLSTLLTSDKTSTVNAINEVFGMASNAGIYNNTTPDSGLTTNIGLEEGVYNITSDLTVNAQLVVPKGAIIDIANGVTLTINGQILAGRYQIFSGNGDVVVDSESQPIGYPEWFGAKANDNAIDNKAAIEKCVKAFCITELSSGDYYVDNTITIDTSNRTLRGVKQLNWSYVADTKKGTRIITKHATNAIILVGTTTAPSNINLSVQNILLEDFTVTRTSGSDWVSGSIGIRFSQVLRSRVNHITCFNNDLGVMLQACTNMHIENSLIFSEVLPTSDTSRSFRGVFIDNSVLSPNNTPNVSIYVRNNIINTGGGVILALSSGINVSGSVNAPSDLFIYENAIEWVANGIEMLGTTTSGTVHDVHFIHNEMDVIKSNGIILQNIASNNTVIVEDNYIAPASNADTPFSAIRLVTCGGVSLHNNVIVSKNFSNTYGIYATTSNTIHSVGNIITSCLYGYYCSSVACSEFNDIITTGTLVAAAGGSFTDCSHNIISSAIRGANNRFNDGIRLEGSSAANEVNVTKFLTGAISSGTAHFVYVLNAYASAVGVVSGNLISGIMA